MIYLPHVFARKPLYAALAMATMSFGACLGIPGVALAAQASPQTASATTTRDRGAGGDDAA